MVETRQIPSFFFFFSSGLLLYSIKARSYELVLVQNVCVQQALLWATECANHPEQDEVMSQQVGDHNICPMTQLELRAALPTSAFEGIIDVFLLVCRHIKPLCALLKILQQRPGTATTQSPTWLTGSVFLISDLQQGRTSGAGEQPAMKWENFNKHVEPYLELYLSAIHEYSITTPKHAVVKAM